MAEHIEDRAYDLTKKIVEIQDQYNEIIGLKHRLLDTTQEIKIANLYWLRRMEEVTMTDMNHRNFAQMNTIYEEYHTIHYLLEEETQEIWRGFRQVITDLEEQHTELEKERRSL